MKFLDEYRDAEKARGLSKLIHKTTKQDWTLMEVCGGQTHAIMKYGLEDLLPKGISLLHGPGCPVCVTPVELIDRAIAIAQQPKATLCSFGDMLRVPGSEHDLLSVKAWGGDVRVVYSPLDALDVAEKHPDREVVFFAVGFETTAPANAMAVIQAQARKIQNFSILVSQVMVPPAMEAVLSSEKNRVQGFLAAGHVCTVMGFEEYGPIADKYRVPIVVTGFEPVDILQGIQMCIAQLEEGRYEVENQYRRVVRAEGNTPAQNTIREVFEVVPRKWRGIGEIPQSGLGLRSAFAEFDAEKRFQVESISCEEDPRCVSGSVLQGLVKPYECKMFAGECTPEHPIGATMVSSEGACAAYFQYRAYKEREV